MINERIFRQSPWRAIFSLSVPSLITIVVMMLYNMADMFFVGQIGDVSAVAAVSLASPVFSILMALSTMLGNGGCTKIAQSLGRADSEAIHRYTAICFWSSIVFGVIFFAACWFGCDPLLRFLGTNAETLQDTKSYVLIMAAGAPVVLLNHSIGSALRGEGEIKAGLAGNMISTITNIVLDPIFIAVLGLGVAGAAIATVIANGIAFLYYMVYSKVGKSHCIIETSPRYATSLRELLDILALGLPNAISTGLSGFAGSFSNRIIAGYGTAAVAAMAAVSKTAMLTTMVAMGICMGVQPLLAYWYGNQNWAQLKAIMSRTLFLTLGLGIVLTGLIFINRSVLIGLFIKDAATVELGCQLSFYLLLAAPFIGIYYLASNFLQASGAAVWASFSSALRQGVLLIPLLHIMNTLYGMNGAVQAYFFADAISVVITGALALYYYRKRSRAATAVSVTPESC